MARGFPFLRFILSFAALLASLSVGPLVTPLSADGFGLGSPQESAAEPAAAGVEPSGQPEPPPIGDAAGNRAAALRFLSARGWSPSQPAATALWRARRQGRMQIQPGDVPASLGGAWLPIGPLQVTTAAFGSVTGRVTTIAVDPADLTGNTVFVGTAGGGVWRSTNAAGPASAVVFSPLTDSLTGNTPVGPASLSIGAISVQPGGTGVVLVGTGDPNDALDSYWGSGILRSTDGGTTWSSILRSNETGHSAYSSRDFIGEAFAGFAWSTVNRSLVVAAVSHSAEGQVVNAPDGPSQSGLFYSTDAGATWLFATVTDGALQIVQDPSYYGPGNAVTAVVWNPLRQRFYAAIRLHGYYESVDGINWTRLVSQPGAAMSPANCPTYASVACPLFRGALAVQGTSGDMFAISTDINNLNQGVWQDTCAAARGSCTSPTVNFASLPSQALQNSSHVIAQGDYNLWIAAVPVSNDTLLYAGTEDIFRCSLSGGCNWRNATNVNTCAAAGVAPAQHAVDATRAGSSTSPNPGLMYFGNDGGLWRSSDGVQQTGAPCSADDPVHFQNLNGGIGSLAEVLDLASDPANPAILLAAQGNLGTSTANPPGQPVWPQVLGGEGSHVAIDPTQTSHWFSASGSGVSIHACTQGDNCTIAAFGPTVIGSAQVGGDGNALDYPAPWILDPQDPTRMIVGTCRIWRGPTSGGSNWSASNALSVFFDNGGPSASNPVCTSNAVVRSLAASGTVSNLPANQEVIYAGMAGRGDGGSTVAGRIYSATVSAQAGTTTVWKDLSMSKVTNDYFANNGQFNPGGFAISTIAIDPHDATGATIYATVEGFSGNGVSEPRIYASTDGGAHWQNVTSNVPAGPVNTLVVDPQNANTVYVGTDVGVYVSRQIRNCSISGFHCWSPYGTGLPDAPVMKLNVFNALTPGAVSSQGELQAATYGRGIWQTPLLVIPTTTATLTPAALSYGDQAIHAASAAQLLTLTNTGTVALGITQITSNPDYPSTNDCNYSVAVGASCTFLVTFNPSQLGPDPATLIVYGNFPTGQLSVALTGNGIAGGVMVFLPSSVDYGVTLVGNTSASVNVTISNTGTVTVAMTSQAVSADYALLADTCVATLPPNTGCTVSIAFKPTLSGYRPGALSVIDSVGTQTVQLTGTGLSLSSDTLTPRILTFGGQRVNTLSDSQPVTLTNTGDQSLTLIAASVTGDYTISNNCGDSLVGHSSCVIDVRFAPTRVGVEGANLTVSDSIHSQNVSLSGTGTPATTDEIAPLSVVFAPQTLNTTSSSKPVTLINSGEGVLTLISAQITGDFVFSSGCPPTVQPHSSCIFAVSYLPTRLGAETGTLLVTDANGTQGVPLSGSGIASTTLSAAPTTLSFGNVNVGVGSPPLIVTYTNQSLNPINGLVFSTLGDYAIVADSCPVNLAAAVSCALQVVFTPTVVGSRPGTLTAGSPGLAATLLVPLTGNGQANATDNLSPSTLDFGSVPLNTASTLRHISVTNSGTVDLTGIAAHTTGAFLLGQSTCGPTLGPNSTCAFGLEFLPTTQGANAGSLIVVDSVQSQTVPLTGFGQAAAGDALRPATLSFGNQVLNTASTPQQATLQNTGDVTLGGISVAVSGDFTLNNLCGATLPAHTTCTMTVTYLPTVSGAETGALKVIDELRSQVVTLTGNGVVAPTDALTPASLTFFPQALNTSSAPQAVTLSNSGGTTLTGITAAITGDYNLTAPGTCGTTLPAGASCIFNVTFLPTHGGADSGTLTVTDALRVQTVALNGPVQSSATDALAPPTLAFGSEPVGLPSTSQPVTLTNGGDATLTGIKSTITGDFSVVSTCGVALVGHSACTFSVIYTPTHATAATGTLTVTDAIQAQKVTLSGTGTGSGTGGGGASTFTITNDGAATATIASGATAAYTVDVNPAAGSSGTVAMSCTGLPQFATCSFSPATAALVPGAVVKVAVSISTGIGISLSRAGSLPLDRGPSRLVLLLGILIPLGLLGRRRRFRAGLLGSVLLLASLAGLTLYVGACGGATVSSGSQSHQNVTPAGTSTVTIKGTIGAEVESTTVTVVVQ